MIIRFIARAALTALALAGIAAPAAAQPAIQTMKSRDGVPIWLVQNKSPLITLRFAFKGGELREPADKPGIAALMAYSFNEGAGDMDSVAFLKQRDRIAADLAASAGSDAVYVSFATVNQHRDKAFELLELAFARPRFDAQALAISKANFRSNYETALRNPTSLLARTFFAALYANHRLASDTKAKLAALDGITPDDIKAARAQLMTRANMVVSAVGDIDPATLTAVIDRIASYLPAGVPVVSADPMPPTQARHIHLDHDQPQTQVMFGYTLPRLSLRERMVSSVLDSILSGGMTSRLFTEVREKRGLVYGVSASHGLNAINDEYTGGFGAAPQNATAALAQTYGTLRAMAEAGPTVEELERYKSTVEAKHLFMTETGAGLAGAMLGGMLRDVPATALETYLADMQTITLAEVRDLARKLLHPERFVVVSLGRPGHSLAVP